MNSTTEIKLLSLNESMEFIFDDLFFSGLFSNAREDFNSKYKKYLHEWGYNIDYIENSSCNSHGWFGCDYIQTSEALHSDTRLAGNKLNQRVEIKCFNGKFYKRVSHEKNIGKNKGLAAAGVKNGFIDINGNREFIISPWVLRKTNCPNCNSPNVESNSQPMTVGKVGKTEIVLYLGDITQIKADAIVNAANPSLMGGGGVDGAIHEVGGPELDKECLKLQKIGGCSIGDAKITTGGNLPAKFVIHTVGPRWGKDSDPRTKLMFCYKNSLLLGNEKGVRSIIFSSISTGIYGYPVNDAAAAAKIAVLSGLDAGVNLETVGWCLFDEPTFEAYRNAWVGE